MERITHRLAVASGELFGEMDEQRVRLFSCSAEIQIIEHCYSVPVLGQGRIITGRDAALLVTFDHGQATDLDVTHISGFSFCGDVFRQDGARERLTFSGMELLSDLDLTGGGSCTFRLRCSEFMLKKLRGSGE